MKKIVILFSEKGSNLHNIISNLHNKKCEVVCAITNNPNAQGLNNLHVRSEILEHTNFDSREKYDEELVKLINLYKPDLVVLAGFMRILTSIFTQNIKAINLHPSLLPKHKGINAIKEAFYSGDKEAGVTIHWVENELDGGVIIAQKSFIRSDNETLKSFTCKIKELEYELLPQIIVNILMMPLYKL